MVEQRSQSIGLKQEAVKMVLKQGLTQQEASRRLNIPKGTIGTWVAKAGGRRCAQPGDPSIGVPAEEIRVLHKQLAEARMEKENPRKAAAFVQGVAARYAAMNQQWREFKAATKSAHLLPVESNLLEQRIAAIRTPGTVYGTEIAYIPTEQDLLNPAGVKGFATREIIGHSVGERIGLDLVHGALWMAIRHRRPQPPSIHRSDRGSS